MKRIAKVIDNHVKEDDGSFYGKIRIRVLPEMETLSKDECPFAYPILRNNVKQNLPQVDDFIIIEMDENFSNFTYDGSIPYLKENQTINLTNTQPNFIYSSSKDNLTIYHSEEDKECGIVYNNKNSLKLTQDELKIKHNNTEIEIDKIGNIVINSVSNITIKNTSQNLKDLIDSLLDILMAMKTYGSPALHQVSPDDISKLALLKTKFATLLK